MSSLYASSIEAGLVCVSLAQDLESPATEEKYAFRLLQSFDIYVIYCVLNWLANVSHWLT